MAEELDEDFFGDIESVAIYMESFFFLIPSHFIVCLDGAGRIDGTDPKLNTEFRLYRIQPRK